MRMYNLTEYIDNNSDTLGCFRQFKRDESYINNTGRPANVGNTAADGVLKNVKIAVPLRYLSNFWRSLEMPLINSKIHLELNWTKSCAMSDIAGETTLYITNTNLYVLIVTLSTKDNVKLTKQLNEGLKRLVYWNKYKTKIETNNLADNSLTKFYLDASFEGVKRLFVLAFNDTTVNIGGNSINNTSNRVVRDSHRKYFLPRANITNYNVLIEARNFYDQTNINQIKKV